MKNNGKLAKKIVAILVAIVMVFQYGLGVSEVSAAETYDMVEKGFVQFVKIEAEVNKVYYDVTEEDCPSVPKDANVKVRIAYNPEYDMTNNKKIKFSKGDAITYQLPEGIRIEKKQTGDVMDGPTVVGDYVIDTDGKITITITNEIYLEATDGNLKNGTISFRGKFNAGSWGTGGDKELFLGGKTIIVPFEEDTTTEKADITITKDDVGNQIKWDREKGWYYIEYTIKVKTDKANTKTIENIVVTDKFTSGASYIDTSGTIEGVASSGIYYQEVPAGTTFDKESRTWTIGAMAKNQTKTLKFKVKLADKMTQLGSAADRVVKNTATLKADGISKTSSATTTTKAGVTIEKTNAGYNIEDKTVTYTVKVQADSGNKWTLNNVKVEDLFGDNKEYVTDYVSSSVTKGEVAKDIAKKKTTWTVGTLEPNEIAILEYTVRISDDIFAPEMKEGTVTRVLENTATVKVNGSSKGNSNSDVNFKKVWISKTGSLQNNGKIKFTIKANASTNKMPVLDGPFEFYDALGGSKWVYDEESPITINWYSQGPTNKGKAVGTKTLYINNPTDGLAVNSDKTSWRWTSESGPYYYEIVYYAKLKNAETIGRPSISNKAGIIVGIGDNDYTHEASWSGYGKTYDALRKNNEAVNGETASWKSSIICSVPEGATYEDFRDEKSGLEWFMTDDQISNIRIIFNGEPIKGSTEITKKGSGFIVKFKYPFNASAENPIYIYYDTTLEVGDLDPAETGTYVNKAKLTIGGNTDSAEAECTYLKDHKFDKLPGAYDPETKYLTWDMKVNITGSMKGTAHITDNLPDGLEFVKAEITKKGSEASENTKIECSPSEDKKSVGITVENLVKSGNKDAYVIITLTTKVVDTKVLLGIKKDTNGDGEVNEKDDDSHTFENDASLFYGGRTYNDSAEHEINNVTLTKHGIYNEDTAPNIVYEIEVNPEGVDMLSGENEQWITVEDTMSDNLIFIQDSLKVEHLTTGEAVAYKNLVVGENKENLPYFTLEVPDNKPLKITYQAYVSGETGKPAEAVNTVKFLGYGSYPGEEASNSIEILESKATIEGETNFFIKKTDGVTFEPLAGAVYELTEYKLNGTTIETERRTVKSDNLGTVIFNNLDEDCVYGFKEVTAPEGYYIDEINAKETFVAIESNELTDGLRNELIAKLEAEGKKINYMKKGASFYRNNYKGEISVDKNFIGEVTDGTYYFGLFNTNGKIVTLNGNTAVVSADVKDGQFVKEAVFRGVPFGKYYVYETDAEGKRLTTDSEGAVTVNGVKYLVSGEGSVEVSYEKPKATIDITNEYNAEAWIELEAGKILENANYPLRDAQFSFKLAGPKLDNGEVVVTNDAEGKVSFPEITYKVSDLAGASERTFNYTISEVIPDEKQGITYSTDIYDVEVKVKKANGELSAEYKVLLNGKEVTLAQFTNTYDAEGKVQFEGAKVLENANYELKDNQFSFELTGPKLDDGVVVTNDAEGKIRFPEIEYELADLNGNRSATFEYTVSEVNGGKTIEGVTYSDEVFDIVVTVTDNLDGTLKTEYVAKNSDGEAGEIEFINIYDAKPISTTIEGKKEAVGFTLQEGDFGFVLVETTEGVAEDALYTAYESNAADGTFEFELPKYDLSDNGKEFTYEVREYVPEDANKKGGVTYDSAVYTVTVRISDNMDGTLNLEKAITKGGETVSEPVGFTNEFAGSVELTKTNGKTGNDYETLPGAVFKLYKVNGASDELIGTYTTGEGGKIRAEGLVEGEYYFLEETPPAGYNIVTDASGAPLKYEFQIGPNGGEAVVNKNIEIANEQKLGELSLIKKDAESATLIEGAVFTLYKDGKPWQEGLTTDEKGLITVTALPWGEYYFVETAPAPGYVADTKPTDKVVIDAKYVDEAPVTVEKTNKQTEFYITKTDINGENYLTGSTIEIFKVVNAGVQPASEDGAISGEEDQLIPITSWTSDGSNHLIKGMLEVGETYIIKETAAPTGYGYIESYIEFTVNEDGSITSDANFAIDENGKRVLLVQDDIIDLKVTKTDYVTGKNLEGAVLAVFDKESGEEIVRWTSTKEGHYDFGAHLTANKTYILKELQAPEGYEKIDDVVFKVLNEGQVEVVTESELVKYEDGQLEIGNCPIPPEEPDTGDHTPLGMSMILMTLAMIGMVSAAMPRKRRSH